MYTDIYPYLWIYIYIQTRLFLAHLPKARRWRLATGHLENFYDPLTGASLTSRVCGNDRALHVATGQASLYRLVATYLGSDDARGENLIFRWSLVEFRGFFEVISTVFN